MRMLIVGPPGAGKGTQAEALALRHAVPAISTGDLFRANLAQSTPLGLAAKRYIEAGDYVPDDVVNDMVRPRLSEADAGAGFLLDGYPRTPAQVRELDGFLTPGAQLDAVIVLRCERDELVRRLLLRASSDNRSDDTEEVVRHRLEVFHDQTAPIVELYRLRGIAVEVDAIGTVGAVRRRIRDALRTVTDPSSPA